MERPSGRYANRAPMWKRASENRCLPKTSPTEQSPDCRNLSMAINVNGKQNVTDYLSCFLDSKPAQKAFLLQKGSDAQCRRASFGDGKCCAKREKPSVRFADSSLLRKGTSETSHTICALACRGCRPRLFLPEGLKNGLKSQPKCVVIACSREKAEHL